MLRRGRAAPPRPRCARPPQGDGAGLAADDDVAPAALALGVATDDAAGAMLSLCELTHGRWRAVPVLGITQIVAWGTIFYSPVLTAPLIAAECQWSLSFT